MLNLAVTGIDHLKFSLNCCLNNGNISNANFCCSSKYSLSSHSNFFSNIPFLSVTISCHRFIHIDSFVVLFLSSRL
ncbi:MAG: hypothetical protein WCG25_03255 [bacterium]